MEKFSKERLITGAKKAGKCLSVLALATTIALANPMTAAAHVDAQNIIGEEQTIEDRSEVRRTDAIEVNSYFCGYDYYGNPFVTNEQIRKAIELSNVLNAYNNFEANEFSNTRKGEVLNLNIDAMYDEYCADFENGYQNFCANNITNKPALDAYLNFACGTISQSIKNNLCETLFGALFDAGYVITEYPRIETIDGKLYAIVGVNGYTSLVSLNTKNISDVKYICNALDYRYGICLANLAGDTKEYENAFSYNGIDTVSNESAWLSLGDDGLKEMLTISADFQEKNNGSYNITVENGSGMFVYDEKDIEALRAMGYTEDEIRNAVKFNTTVTLNQELVK